MPPPALPTHTGPPHSAALVAAAWGGERVSAVAAYGERVSVDAAAGSGGWRLRAPGAPPAPTHSERVSAAVAVAVAAGAWG